MAMEAISSENGGDDVDEGRVDALGALIEEGGVLPRALDVLN